MEKQQLIKQMEENDKKMSKAANFEGIVLCATETTDYGASKIYKSMMNSWNNASEESKKTLVNMKQHDSDGNPLWSDMNSKFKSQYMNEKTGLWLSDKERKINLEREQRREITLLA